MTKIMVVDDDASIRRSLVRVLGRNGYEVLTAADGEEAIRIMRSDRPELVILDIMLPKMNGYLLCAKLREEEEGVPVIFLSAKGDIVDKTMGFRSGADDYMTKPFDVEELCLRIEAVLRRAGGRMASEMAERIELGDLVIMPKNYSVSVGGRSMDLKAKEFEVLNCMAQYPGQVFSRRRIYESVWGEDSYGDDGVVAVYVRKIREQIEEDPKHPKHLITVWGVGYKLE